MSEGQPNTPHCEEPGCGLPMRQRVRYAKSTETGFHYPERYWVCPATPREHELSAKLAATEAKVRELELTLAGAIQRGGELIGERDALVATLATTTSANAALEEKLGECCHVIRSMTSRALLDGFESPDELEAWMTEIFQTGKAWLETNLDLVKKDDEARKKGAEHGDA